MQNYKLFLCVHEQAYLHIHFKKNIENLTNLQIQLIFKKKLFKIVTKHDEILLLITIIEGSSEKTTTILPKLSCFGSHQVTFIDHNPNIQL